MEKKVPERKVGLQEGDIFYVYDKRINKCVKEDCNGTVKYGLILKVSMKQDETCNCFECNKCHMKYTPYPNYVRLSDGKSLAIYNQAEVTARDEKRAEDARKTAIREKREQKLIAEKERRKKEGYKKEGFNKDNFKKEGFKKEGFKKEGYKKRSNIVISGDGAKRFSSYNNRIKTNSYTNDYRSSKNHQD